MYISAICVLQDEVNAMVRTLHADLSAEKERSRMLDAELQGEAKRHKSQVRWLVNITA